MRPTIGLACGAAMLLLANSALPCGGGFGQELTIRPSQNILLAYRGGEETYVFGPHFCGAASDFGLILPIPGTLTQDPVLASANLVTELEGVSAPIIQEEEVCENVLSFGASKGSDGNGATLVPEDDGVQVVKSGQVGIFGWELLKADSARSFTDWLAANDFPSRASAQSAFEYYVQAGWYFVAFRITASAEAPPAGYRVCGDLGPIQLTFQAPQAVVPARIASADGSGYTLTWRVFTLSTHQLQTSTVGVQSTRRYSGALSAADLSKYSTLSQWAQPGEWLTKLDFTFFPVDQGAKAPRPYGNSLTQDILLAEAPSDVSYRDTVVTTRTVTCVCGCRMVRGSGPGLTGVTLVVNGLVLSWLLARRRRRPRWAMRRIAEARVSSPRMKASHRARRGNE
jgi:hypothetical protein